MLTANNTTSKQNKSLKKMMRRLQSEMSTSVLDVMKKHKEPLDLAQIITLYPDDERRKSCKSDIELKHYISIGLGKLIMDKQVRELPKSIDGRLLLEVVLPEL